MRLQVVRNAGMVQGFERRLARLAARRAGTLYRRVQGSGFRLQGSGFRVQGAGFRIQGSGFRVQGAGFRVQGSGFNSWASSRSHLVGGSFSDQGTAPRVVPRS